MMKKLLFKTILVAAAMCVGTSAWGAGDYNATTYEQDYETESTYAQGWTYSNMAPSQANNAGNHYLLFTQSKNASASISFASNYNFSTAINYRFSFKMNMNYHTGAKTTTVTVTGKKNGESVTLVKIVSKDNVEGYNSTSHVFKADDSEITTFTNGGYGNSATMVPTIPVVITSNSSEGTKVSVNGCDAVSLDAGLVTITGISISTGNSSALKVSFDDMMLEAEVYYNKSLYSQNYEDAETYKTGWVNSGRGSINQKVLNSTTYLYLQHNGESGSQTATFTYATAGMDFSLLTDYCYEFDYAHSAGNNNRSTFTLKTSEDETLLYFTDNDISDSGSGITTTVKDGKGTSLGTFTTDAYLKGGPYNANTIYRFQITSNTSGTKLTVRNASGDIVINNATLATGLVQLKSFTFVNARALSHTIFGNMTLREHATEEVTDPTINIVVSGTDREVTIDGGTSSLEYSKVKTYYTLDGSTPTSSNTLYTSPFMISSNCTVKAISIGQAGSSSNVVSEDVTVGEVVLNAPSVTMDLTSYVDGNYYVPSFTFSQDQSDLTYVPTSVTLSYTVNGGEAVEATTYSPTEEGEVIVTVTAEGYTSASTSFNVPYLVYKKTTTLDFTAATYPSGHNFTAGSSNVATAYNSVNKVNNSLTGISTPEELAGYLAFQDIYNGSGNGWGIRVNGTSSGLFGYGSARAAAVLGRTAGQIVAFNCASNAYNVITYTNKSGNPDGKYTMQISSDNKTYYATMTADDRIGFCRKDFGNYILSIVIYDPVVNVNTTLGSNGYATFASPYPLDLTTANLPTGLTAYKASVSGTTVTFTELNQTVPANTGILLQGEAGGSYNIPVVASGTEVTENAFLVNTDGTTFAGDNDYYYFGLLKNTLTFGTFDPSSVAIPASKAYLKVLKSSLDAGARLNISFADDETTGIADVRGKMSDVRGGYYNLSGQRVDQPQKGLYIVNGKKVVIK